ncbi:hypothetical protein AWM75_01755 [Aerococcus urinaehominis]|uniref:Uncharacterized protein n=1 Tax=Aerococcus urinaehominis TaxID=128944 RepID=A0A109RGP0_9LACT|nr:sugar-binding domain-containing protein [Aerococcus urinaehominis]AMB98796.1 hypothetical protein AWM75_01755 [Aerococcus urinaehominis]SDM12367.1 central glycolytic genes regulator [Aerococcus urinaehominis]
MVDSFEKLSQVVPEIVATYRQRILILETIFRLQPIGRKMLAELMFITERRLRTEVDILKNQQLLESTPKGMRLTSQGELAIADAREFKRELSQFHRHEQKLANQLGFHDSRIVTGNLDEDSFVYFQMGSILSQYLDQHLAKGRQLMAVTGGTTMMNVMKYIQPKLALDRAFTIVSARGGIGDAAATQANTISDRLANRLSGRNISLYAPETLSQDAFDMLIEEPSIKKTLAILSEVNVLLFSVGDATIMAKRRGLDDKSKQIISDSAAIGEAFGCFFDEAGQIVYRVPRVGLQLEDLASIDLPILISGGSDKARALAAFAKLAPSQTVLITDEGAANLVLNEETH